MTKKIQEFLLGDTGRKALIIGALAVMVLLLLSTFSCDDTAKKSTADTDFSEDAEQLERALENRVKELVKQISGAGDVHVMVTLDTISEVVYEKDKRSELSSQNAEKGGSQQRSDETEVVLAGSAKQPLQIGRILPKVRGAAVVCSGASDPVVRERITNAVAGALDLSAARVYVTF